MGRHPDPLHRLVAVLAKAGYGWRGGQTAREWAAGAADELASRAADGGRGGGTGAGWCRRTTRSGSAAGRWARRSAGRWTQTWEGWRRPWRDFGAFGTRQSRGMQRRRDRRRRSRRERVSGGRRGPETCYWARAPRRLLRSTTLRSVPCAALIPMPDADGEWFQGRGAPMDVDLELVSVVIIGLFLAVALARLRRTRSGPGRVRRAVSANLGRGVPGAMSPRASQVASRLANRCGKSLAVHYEQVPSTRFCRSLVCR